MSGKEYQSYAEIPRKSMYSLARIIHRHAVKAAESRIAVLFASFAAFT